MVQARINLLQLIESKSAQQKSPNQAFMTQVIPPIGFVRPESEVFTDACTFLGEKVSRLAELPK